MRAESRELYCYITGTESFKSRYENLSTEMISLSIATRGLVKDAIGQYGKDYGNGNGFEIFSEDDFKECANKIIKDVKEREGFNTMDDYTREYLTSRFDENIVDAREITEWRKPNSGIETEGAIWMSAKWIEEHLEYETMQDAYDNISPLRQTYDDRYRFDAYEFFELYDREEVLKIGGIVLEGACVYLEVWNMRMDRAVAYIGIN